MTINRQGSASFIQTSAPASLPLQLVSSSFLTGSVGSEPSYTGAQTLGLVSGANIVGQSLFTPSGNTVSITAGIIALSGVDFFAAPPCSLQISLTSSYSVLYLWKKISGAAADTTQIGLLPTSGASDAQDALSMAQSALNGVYIPLCVLSADSQANQSIEWSLDKNSQYSSPILDQLGQISSWQGNTETFIKTQLSALMSDLTGFASWEQAAHNNQVYISFNPNASQNGLEVLGEWTPGGNPGFSLPFISASYLTRSATLTLMPHVMTASSPVQTITLPQNHDTSNGNDFYFAPSQDVYFPACLMEFQNGSFGGIKNAVWQTSGNLVLTGNSTQGQQFMPVCSTLSPLPDGISILRYNGTEQVATLPPNPLANPTFQTDW